MIMSHRLNVQNEVTADSLQKNVFISHRQQSQFISQLLPPPDSVVLLNWEDEKVTDPLRMKKAVVFAALRLITNETVVPSVGKKFISN